MCVLKMKFLLSAFQKLSSEQTHGQTDGQTDRQTWLKLLPTTYADGNKALNMGSYETLLYKFTYGKNMYFS